LAAAGSSTPVQDTPAGYCVDAAAAAVGASTPIPPAPVGYRADAAAAAIKVASQATSHRSQASLITPVYRLKRQAVSIVVHDASSLLRPDHTARFPPRPVEVDPGGGGGGGGGGGIETLHNGSYQTFVCISLASARVFGVKQPLACPIWRLSLFGRARRLFDA